MLSKKAKYSIRALMLLAKNYEKTLPTIKISEDENIPKKFLEQILLELKKENIVESTRGTNGGYYLAKKPDKIMVGDIIRIIDGPLAPIRCASITAYKKCDDCKDEKTCVIRKLMFEVRNHISEVLDHKTLKQLIETPETKIKFI